MLASKFIDQVKRGANVPSSEDLFTDTDFLAFADSEMNSHLLPWLLKVNEDYATVQKDIPIVVGTSVYVLPARAAGTAILDVQYVDSNGNIENVTRLWTEDRTGKGDSGFCLNGNTIEILPVPTMSNMTLRLTFSRSASSLVPITSVARINTISGLDVTVDSLPTTIASGGTVDLVPKSAPYYSLGDDIVVSGVSGLILTLASVPSTLSVGDYVCVAQESPFVQLSREMTPMLVQMVIVKVHEALAHFDAQNYAQKRLEQMKNELLDLTTPRVAGEPKKIRVNALGKLNRGWSY